MFSRSHIVLVVTVVCISPPALSQTDGGLLYNWRLNETNGHVVVDQVSRLDAAIVGNPLMGLPGARGFAFAFDGTSDYLATSPTEVSFTKTNFTLTAWVRCTTYQTKVATVIWLQHGMGWFELYLSGDEAGFFIQNYSTGAYALLDGVTRLTDGNWHFLAAVRSGQLVILYADGVYQDSAVVDLGIIAGVAAMEIGGKSKDHLDFFRGLLDDVAVYSRALSVDEVLALASPFKPVTMLNVVSSGDGSVLSFETGQLPATHDVQQSEDLLSETSWLSITRGTWSSSVCTVTVPLTNGQGRGFFRLKSDYYRISSGDQPQP